MSDRNWITDRRNWITDRLPTVADGDRDGYVAVLLPSDLGNFIYSDWKYVTEYHAWLHTDSWVAPARRFVSITRTVNTDGTHTIDAIDDDGIAWWMVPGETGWQQMTALPPREVLRASADA